MAMPDKQNVFTELKAAKTILTNFGKFRRQ